MADQYRLCPYCRYQERALDAVQCSRCGGRLDPPPTPRRMPTPDPRHSPGPL